MALNFQDKYFDLEKNHKKLLGVTMALIEALELAVTNKELNLETTLTKCMNIYPELFNQELPEQQLSPLPSGRQENDKQLCTLDAFQTETQKPAILIELDDIVMSDSKTEQIPIPMPFPTPLPVTDTTKESYSDSEAYSALKTVTNPMFLRANSISVTESNQIIDLPNYSQFTIQSANGKIISQNLPLLATSNILGNSNSVQNSSSVLLYQLSDNEKNSSLKIDNQTNIDDKTVNRLNSLSDGVKKRQKEIDETSAEESDKVYNFQNEAILNNVSDKDLSNPETLAIINLNKMNKKSQFYKVKHDIIFNSIDKQIKILETLRKKLIHSLAQDRANTLDVYINHDIFDIYSHQILFKKLLPLGLVNGWDLKLQQVILKFINSVSSIQKGRDYLTSNDKMASYLSGLYTDKNHQKGMCITKNKEMIMAIFHKLSVKPNQQAILKTILKNVVTDFLENQNLTFYQIRHTLGYLINMCLIPENICSIEKFASDLLQMLSNLLVTKDLKILTEVDRLLYILMSNNKYQSEAKSLGLPAMIKQISEKFNKRLKSQLDRVIAVMSMPVPHNNLETVKDEYLNYIEIELNELEEEVEIGESTSVIDIKEIIKDEKEFLMNSKNEIEGVHAKTKTQCNKRENMAMEIDNKNKVRVIEKKERIIKTATTKSKRFVQNEIGENQEKVTKGLKKKHNDDDKNNNMLFAKDVVLKAEDSFIVLDDNLLSKTNNSKIKKRLTTSSTGMEKKKKHQKDKMKYDSFDYCEETKQIQAPLRAGNMFDEFRHSPYKEFIETTEFVGKTRPNSRVN